MELVSQKAIALKNAIGKWNVIGLRIPNTIFYNALDEYTYAQIREQTYTTLRDGYDIFLRPCPKIPNHGGDVAGMQSHRAEWSGRAKAIQDTLATLAAKEPESDLIVMSYINADASAVMAPDRYVTFGLGNAGVTSGKGNSIVFPVVPSVELNNLIVNIGEKVEQTEIELLYDGSSRPWLVQFRRAPEHKDIAPPPAGAVQGFVPEGKMRIARVINIKDLKDLGVLEQADIEPGTLVIQPQGSMLSHAAAHCRAKNIAFAVCNEFDFQIGSMITEVSSGWIKRGDLEIDKVDKYSYLDYSKEFLEGIEHGRTHYDKNDGKLGIMFHQLITMPMNGPVMTAKYAGVYVAWLVQAGFIACLGEARHVFSQSQKPASEKRRVGGLLAAINNGALPENIDDSAARSEIYHALDNKALNYKDIEAIAQWLGDYAFDDEWTHSFGGKSWQNCSYATAKLANALQSGNVADIVIAANSLENAAHNGGWLFGKFVSDVIFTMSTSGANVEHMNVAFTMATYILNYRFDGSPHHAKSLAKIASDMQAGKLHRMPSSGNSYDDTQPDCMVEMEFAQEAINE